MGVTDGRRIPRGWGQGLWVAESDGEQGKAVVLVLGDGGWCFPGAQGVALRQLVPQFRHSFFFLRKQNGYYVKKAQRDKIKTCSVSKIGSNRAVQSY